MRGRLKTDLFFVFTTKGFVTPKPTTNLKAFEERSCPHIYLQWENSLFTQKCALFKNKSSIGALFHFIIFLIVKL